MKTKPTEDLDQKTLALMHKNRQRPLCPCQTPGIEMYIAKIGDQYIIKRMPNTGSLHSTDCESYEPPAELSGLGDMLGSAIKEDADEGVTELRFDFSLAKVAGRGAPQKSDDDDTSSVRTYGSRLTLRSTLHYLWEEAGFNRWTPAMAGKRNWAVMRKHLLLAAENKIAKGAPLTEQMYIPEFFSVDRKDTILQNRHTQFKWLRSSTASNKMMILIGELKEILPSRFGHKLVIKHCADLPFLINDDLHKRLLKRYFSELDLWDTFEDMHLVIVGTFGLNAANIPILDELSLMATTANWMPFESIYDKAIIDKMTEEKRRFIKGLRYNLPGSKPLASAVLTDTHPLATALYAIPIEPTEGYLAELKSLIEGSRLAASQWDTSEYEIPELPPATPG